MLAVRGLFLKKSALEEDNNCTVFDKMPFQNETVWAIYWNELIPRPWNSDYGKPQLTQLDIYRQIHRTSLKDSRNDFILN
jgi:hypothetical protein